MAVMAPKRQRDGILVYPPIGEALIMVGLDEIGVYITRNQNKVTQYIATRPRLGPSQYVAYALILRYVSKTIYLS